MKLDGVDVDVIVIEMSTVGVRGWCVVPHKAESIDASGVCASV